jgi:hypothetical protein
MQDRDALTALSPGAQLWLIPSLDISAWSRRIDWYLGFQIRRARPYRRFDFGPDMRQLMEVYEEHIPKIPRTENAPLMVASSSLLPNHQTVVIPESPDWVAVCHRVWKDLDEPATRVFLPPKMTRKAFEAAWPEAGSPLEVVSPL